MFEGNEKIIFNFLLKHVITNSTPTDTVYHTPEPGTDHPRRIHADDDAVDDDNGEFNHRIDELVEEIYSKNIINA